MIVKTTYTLLYENSFIDPTCFLTLFLFEDFDPLWHKIKYYIHEVEYEYTEYHFRNNQTYLPQHDAWLPSFVLKEFTVLACREHNVLVRKYCIFS